MADPAKPNLGDGLDKTQIEPRLEATRVEPAPVFKNLNLDGMSPGQTIATQDLTGDKMILAAPRINYNGVQVPALGGIPLLAKLGQGGMGAVYYGIHPRLNKEIAVKVLPFHLAEQQPDMVKRFFREAQIAAMVQSPHLVSAMDVNEEKGLVYLVMEYVNGESSGSYLRKIKQTGQVISETVALDICIAATEGLAGAHNGGIIHRDIKPDNVLIPKNRATNQLNFKAAKLADLGLARGEELGQSLTMGQACMGTPGYMSPEQAMDAKSVGKPADVFSMGAMLYALLCGNAPFTGSTAMKIVMETAQQPHKPLRELREDASAQVSELIDKCLQKAPEKRFADADTLLEALKEVRSGRSSTNVAVPQIAVQVTKEDRKAQVQALMSEATRLAASNPNAALDKLAEAERKMQGDGDDGTILVEVIAEMAEQRRMILQACNRKTHEVDIWHALSNAIPMAMEARKAGDWDVMVAALEGPLNALGKAARPGARVARQVLVAQRSRRNHFRTWQWHQAGADAASRRRIFDGQPRDRKRPQRERDSAQSHHQPPVRHVLVPDHPGAV
jgi:serine/threonine protein kinase